MLAMIHLFIFLHNTNIIIVLNFKVLALEIHFIGLHMLKSKVWITNEGSKMIKVVGGVPLCLQPPYYAACLIAFWVLPYARHLNVNSVIFHTLTWKYEFKKGGFILLFERNTLEWIHIFTWKENFMIFLFCNVLPKEDLKSPIELEEKVQANFIWILFESTPHSTLSPFVQLLICLGYGQSVSTSIF